MDGAPSNQREVPGARATLPAHVVHRQFPTEMVLLNLETGQYHGLNATGGAMFEALIVIRSLELVVRELSISMNQPRGTIERDLLELVRGLEQRGLLVIDYPDSVR